MTTLGVATLDTEVDLGGLRSGLGDARGEADRGFASIAGSAQTVLAAGVVAAAAVAVAAVAGIGAAAFNAADQVNSAQVQIQSQLGVSAAEAERFGDIVTDVYANNFGDSIADVGDAIVTAEQQMNRLGQMSEAELQRATENALALRDAFDVDVAESTNAANALMEQFGVSSDDAMNFITAGLQGGLNASGDFLESIGEYSVQFAEGGATADEFFSVMQTGLQSGLLGTDKAADLFKEFRVRIQDGSDATRNALGAIGLDADEMAAQLADGSLSAIDAFGVVQDALNGTEGGADRFNAGVALMGTQFEDLGESAALAIDASATAMGDLDGSTDSLGAQYNTLGDIIDGFKRRAQVALVPLGEVLLNIALAVMPIVEGAFAWLEDTLMPVIEDVADLFGDFFGALADGEDPLSTLATLGAQLALVFGASEEQAAALYQNIVDVTDGVMGFVSTIASGLQPVLQFVGGFVSWKDVLVVAGAAIAAVVIPAVASIVAAIAPVLAIIAVAIGAVALLRNAWESDWGGIRSKTEEFWAWLGPLVGDAISAVAGLIQDGLAGIRQFWDDHGAAIMEIVSAVWDALGLILEGSFENIRLVFEAFQLLFEGDWRGLGEKVREIVVNIISTIAAVFGTLWTAIGPYFADLWTAIKEWFTETDFKQLGIDVINGIVSGLVEAGGAIKEFLIGLMGDALGAIKEMLGIESPSRVMADEVGEPSAAGIAQGWQIGLGAWQPEADIDRALAELTAVATVNVRPVAEPITWDESLAQTNFTAALPDIDRRVTLLHERDLDAPAGAPVGGRQPINVYVHPDQWDQAMVRWGM